MQTAARKRPSVKNVANLITAVRILLVPVIVGLLYPWGEGGVVPSVNRSLVVGLAFLAAMLGDLADGYLARRRGEVTGVGKLLDPLADKLMVLVVLVLLIPLGWVPAWLVVILMVRELAVNSLRAAAAGEQVVIQASRLGKYKTVYQTAAITACLFHYRLGELLGTALPAPLDVRMEAVGSVLLYVATAVSLWSGLDYFVRFWQKVISPAP